MAGVLIIGAGHGGVQLAASLRDAGFDGAVSLLSEDPDFPYHKPPLSKSFMAAHDTALQPLRAEVFFEQNRIDLKLGTVVEQIDRSAKVVVCSDGRKIAYDKLVIATGTRARRLSIPGADLPEVFYLRTAQDARAMRAALPSMRRVAVIGGGFIGLEAAAMLSGRGVKVDVIEVAPRLLGRATSDAIAQQVANHLQSIDVTLHLCQTVDAITQKDGNVCGIDLGGNVLAADHVLIGVGALPVDMLARDASLRTENGILVDEFLRTEDADIFAIGDCVAFPQVHLGLRTRLESVQNATDQARALALTLTGSPAPYTALPWFWSDIGKLKVQIAGLSDEADEQIETRDAEGNLKSVYHLKNGHLVTCETLNSGGEHMLSRKMIAEGFTPTREQLASGDVKTLKQSYMAARNR
ncbi:FAD-dependent oxidoreductase [Sulfitobacter sp. M57]|uniref:NAD(P)/FAD-dependent oxidoreductase n=1 Tax=unclassified Sulfitobacter TaxID=196795 RepID=UPI0023E1545B|nr:MULTISPECIES: FAD-dependent oxidoreductase [unclassified Sulfitobacter]MDF3416100.1 FAD-dependent oxidoreductase [Sulfitobacter sp. KE5]MDF3423579.1 FAD-dependent oxidoreductase [Sulfitobacter sp. KE43]MDF3434619.1 FAD-dependent oxidoreductase [Sulfitobacter sp. KE42]MDF3460285.1 FAD-dependent oxidoreductase [Sulfitobacter sp. S74]MDF3464157.1 FAD-dependent oxidoreductase [Sulfitobacter sp. Ks18]